jgi:RNA ligase (TIGR02306 family)
MGLTGKLAGKAHNRVKAIRLRQILSQGLVYGLDSGPDGSSHLTYMQPESDTLAHESGIVEGDDVTDLLGITKWEPVIPASMMGEVWDASGKTVKYDIENWKNHPDILEDGEPVVMAEKIHGTFAAFGKVAFDYIVHSKGLGGRGLAFKLNEANANNLYVRQFQQAGGKQILDAIVEYINYDSGQVFLSDRPYPEPIFILGEIFGKGVQDLDYGFNKPEFRIFDIKSGDDYLDYDYIVKMISDINASGAVNIQMAPVLYTGPFSKDVMETYTNGKETVSGSVTNVREGIVIRPAVERRDDTIGRVMLKSVSVDYLLRKGDVTEFN